MGPPLHRKPRSFLDDAFFFHTGLSDIHCGMRAFSRDAFEKMRLQMDGMEFATEMVVAAIIVT